MASEDTDVFLLCLAFKCFIPASMYVKCGTQTRTRYVSISSVMGAVGGELCKCLIGMHVFTGCNTVSAFAGRGKMTVYNLSSSRHPTKKCSSSWGWNGFHQICFFRASKSLHVSSTALNQELITLMSQGIGYSAPRRVTSTPPSYHLVLSACSSMRLAQTSKQPFGSEVCKAAKGHRPPLVRLARRR